MFNSDNVWAAAIHAYDINDGYLTNNSNNMLSNKNFLKESLKSHLYSTHDIEKGIVCRSYFQQYIFLEISNNITSIQRKILEISQIDNFSLDNEFYFTMISFLPYLYDREINHLPVEINPFGQLKYNVNDSIEGQIEVIQCTYNTHYQKYEIEASFEDTIVEWKSKYEISGIHNIKARVRKINDICNKICRVRYLRET